ncbi:MAG: elongation factor P [Nitrospinae bacterium RIFCSPLOWO2_02_FULL_39_110]|jgi:elongation factor P|nr:MAG: elongation factor P [Nitrospinae bacterium RIFCSPHIGHO2_12_FULL_39_42]OGV99042.1 MAG: elongation factor P [Nitrospinae bacterium RIFCSPHIGHO2_02_39_11]OGW03105.1 MAG: elongation factor P [Nitrospinae bacterium RIFCSPHIGHO2_02_FULL_39_82]OGW03283.1 MAG: elongation factor P [Nitrospinae bacterium RIFCSPLOWO2_02_39_17]OGW03636.1 MAG: elongation factor P [Nitrospinae bacterium RIFCSPLOWO2_02_FULL_39_110]OGW07860.1 MAG: elongation factor P [Nitrospinae bacterium RIFCSPLOWO2_12_FULL_39_93]O
MISTTDFRNNMKIEYEGDLYVIVEFQHVNPGNLRSFTRTKLKSLKTGQVIEKTFRTGEKFEIPDVEEKQMQFLYKSGNEYYFMDTETYEQLSLTGEQIGDSINFLKENIIITILFHNNIPIGITLPIFVEMKVIKTEPGYRGDTATGASKPATIESGAVVYVPLFVSEGEIIKIDTRTGEYVERVK